MLVGQERLGCSLGALPFTGLPATRIAVSFQSSVLIGGHLPGGVLPVYWHSFAAASWFRLVHNRIRSELVYIAQAASAAQHCQDIPFCAAPPLLRRHVRRAKFVRNAVIRAGARFELLVTSERYLLVSCAWQRSPRTDITSHRTESRDRGFTLIVIARAEPPLGFANSSARSKHSQIVFVIVIAV